MLLTEYQVLGDPSLTKRPFTKSSFEILTFTSPGTTDKLVYFTKVICILNHRMGSGNKWNLALYVVTFHQCLVIRNADGKVLSLISTKAELQYFKLNGKNTAIDYHPWHLRTEKNSFFLFMSGFIYWLNKQDLFIIERFTVQTQHVENGKRKGFGVMTLVHNPLLFLLIAKWP